MRRSGLLNPDLSYAVSRLGHTDTFAIGDCGLPIPHDVKVIDLSLVFGIPSFHDVVNAILSEVVVEATTIATATPPNVRDIITQAARSSGHESLTLTTVDHEELKAQIEQCAFVIRTGETTPYANAIFRCGVAF